MSPRSSQGSLHAVHRPSQPPAPGTDPGTSCSLLRDVPHPTQRDLLSAFAPLQGPDCATIHRSHPAGGGEIKSMQLYSNAVCCIDKKINPYAFMPLPRRGGTAAARINPPSHLHHEATRVMPPGGAESSRKRTGGSAPTQRFPSLPQHNSIPPASS